jgi:hypothetical protein
MIAHRPLARRQTLLRALLGAPLAVAIAEPAPSAAIADPALRPTRSPASSSRFPTC